MRWRKSDGALAQDAIPLPGVPLSAQGRRAAGRRAGDRPPASVRKRRSAPGASMVGVGPAARQPSDGARGPRGPRRRLCWAESRPPIVLNIDETGAAGRGGPATRPARGCGWSGSRPTSSTTSTGPAEIDAAGGRGAPVARGRWPVHHSARLHASKKRFCRQSARRHPTRPDPRRLVGGRRWAVPPKSTPDHGCRSRAGRAVVSPIPPRASCEGGST